MKVGFRDGRVQRLFNDHAKLEARYGADVAIRIATRMALLTVARNLSVLPARPPIGFKAVDDEPGHFTVDLKAPLCLRFIGQGWKSRRSKANTLGQIEEIEVIGVE